MSLASLLEGPLRAPAPFLLGTAEELAALFGAPRPALPAGEPQERGGERLAVETGPRLAEACARWLGCAAQGLASGAAPAAGSPEEAAERAYGALLTETCAAVLAADRRQGLYNLFWLAHSREIAEAVERVFSGAERPRHLRYQIHPLLAGLLRRADEAARGGLGRTQRALVEFRLGSPWRDALVRSVIEDQLALTEPDPGAFDPGRVLVPENRRFRISGAAFEEITRILRERLALGLARAERPLREALRAAAPELDPPEPDDRVGCERWLFADAVREHLLRDIDTTGAQLLKSRVLRRELEREGSWAGLLEQYADLTRCVRRSVVVGLLRRSLEFTGGSRGDAARRERFLEGRLFRFDGGGPPQSGVRTAAILFADIRGFTRTSEGAISEGDLARGLYEIFDPAALIVRRFGGSVDKYLGDGFLATFTGRLRPGDEGIAAVRAAVALQQVLGRLRERGRTGFCMGISLHLGRVAIARFFRDESQVDATLIGRQVNIAARLCASGEDPAECAEPDAEAAPPPERAVGEVAIDARGTLRNRGIAVSGALLEALRARIPFEAFREGGVDAWRWYDRELCLWLCFGYVGEARFRGVDAAVPVYSLVPAAPAAR